MKWCPTRVIMCRERGKEECGFFEALLRLCTAKNIRSQWEWRDHASAELSTVHVSDLCLSVRRGFNAAKLHSSASLNGIDRTRKCHLTIFRTKTPPLPCFPVLYAVSPSESRSLHQSTESIPTPDFSPPSPCLSCRYMVLSIQLFTELYHRRKL